MITYVSSSSKFTPSNINSSYNQITNVNKNNLSIEEKANLNLTYCLYVEFVHSCCDEIKSISKDVYLNNGLYKYRTSCNVKF